MSTEDCLSLNNFKLITIFIMISVWNGIHADGAYGTTNHISVNLGDTITLDCDLATAGIILRYPVFWVKEGMTVATKKQNGQPDIANGFIPQLGYTVKYSGRQARDRRLSLTLHRVEPYHAGEYKCYDAYPCQNPEENPEHLCRVFHVNVITCNCALIGVIANMDDDRGVNVEMHFTGISITQCPQYFNQYHPWWRHGSGHRARKLFNDHCGSCKVVHQPHTGILFKPTLSPSQERVSIISNKPMSF